MRQFRRVIHLFENFKILYTKSTFFDKVNRKFWKVFQIIK